MSRTKLSWLKNHWKTIVWPGALIGASVAAYFTQDQWLPHARDFLAFIQNQKVVEDDDHAASPATAGPDTLTLSPVQWKNIGLTVGTIEPTDFVKVVSVPAIVVERAGRSQTEITAPMTGVVTQVYPLEREVIEPGVPLFDLRLTHEDVVTAQSEFLTQLQNLDVINRELARLQDIGEGVIPGKRIVEQQYERDKATASLAALRQSLLLHGLSEEQVANIEEFRKVLRDVTVVAPPFADNHDHTQAGIDHHYHVQSITVNRGESVVAGQLLGVLADHCLLYVQGQAFEGDATRLADASRNGAAIQVVPVSGTGRDGEVLDLKVQSVSDQVDQNSRALKFYLLLPNQLIDHPDPTSTERSFVKWKYRPGQRMEVLIPTSDQLSNKIVLPPDAVVIEGPNAFVFEQNGDNFDRIDVYVLFRDKNSVVLENDGKLIGSSIAMSGAYQMHLALKNQSGGAIDPHAGHNH
jgi:membrane fusion protein, heavy metal efflux system